MGGQLVPSGHRPFSGGNIYADKSSVVLDWLLRIGIDREHFGVREVSKACGLSLGLVQRVFGTLVLLGWLQTDGFRTAKRFSLKRPNDLLEGWLGWYSVVKKCHMWGYHSICADRDQLLERLTHPLIQSKVALALHSAIEIYGYKNTNLNTLELYMVDPNVKETWRGFSSWSHKSGDMRFY